MRKREEIEKAKEVESPQEGPVGLKKLKDNFIEAKSRAFAIGPSPRYSMI